MCGRYQLNVTREQLGRSMKAEVDASLFDMPPRFNIAPTQPVPIVRQYGGGARGVRRIELVRWGLVPAWVKEFSDFKSILVNARSDTAAAKPAFRSAMKYRRCLVPATGFYKWRKRGRERQPHLIQIEGGAPFAMAGLWEHWQDAAGNELESCVILTTDPNEMLADVHDRMPAIVPPDLRSRWLDPDQQDGAAAREVLVPYPAEAMTAVAVSSFVNSPRHEGPRCAEPMLPDRLW